MKRSDATFFSSPDDFHRWLKAHHEVESELLVGYWKKYTDKPSMTWPESVDEALCFGWIDGIRRRIDDQAYCIRFTPRQTKSTWSNLNLESMKRLIAEGRVAPAGMAAYERRTEERSREYSYEQHKLRQNPEFSEAHAARFRDNETAWQFFLDQPPSYRKKVIWWVESAKKPETRARRLERAIQSAENQERSF